ncbi:GNAT family N-acetyltransferase [Clostridium sp. MSJ-11]|uniref:GNAT family N-acetyltransferase n=1 Tax=Clostridium mobile TaxID=2841512 RepID=A0ABS6EJ48_9CLOT|nr:GNAT family N-acetyltransferase [Clostridium mobile]MBU5484807.1 GNAT family N-acetyltransferase [Clostridium mobile]
MLNIIWLDGNDELKDAYKIRSEVFIEEQKVPKEIEIDIKDKISKHIVVYHGEEPIATGRIVIDENICSFGRIAVVKKYRGKGIGEFLVEHMIKKASHLKINEIYIHAQKYAEEFYKKFNFKSFGDIFYEGGIEHINMVLKL